LVYVIVSHPDKRKTMNAVRKIGDFETEYLGDMTLLPIKA